MAPATILIAEDERTLRDALARGLRDAGYEVDLAGTGEQAIKSATAKAYDAILLDILMPQGNGITACREIRRAGVGAPILMLTALDSLDDKIRGLDAGADDYLTKPFEFGELLARLRALGRRRWDSQPTDLVIGDLRIDPIHRTARRGRRDIPLTKKEFAFLHYLAQNAGRIVPRTELHAHVWSDSESPFSNLIDVYASRVRKKVDEGEDIPMIITHRSVGFSIAPNDEKQSAIADSAETEKITPATSRRRR